MNSGRGSIRRKPSIYAAVTRSDHLLDYNIQITSDHKRFPKHLRYQLSDKLVTIASKVSAKLRSAAQLRPNTLKATKKIGKYLDKKSARDIWQRFYEKHKREYKDPKVKRK